MKILIAVLLFLISLTINFQVIDFLTELKPVIRNIPIPESALRTEPKDFNYPYYTGNVRASIAEHWKVPEERQKAKAVVVFNIVRNGTLGREKVKIAESTGNKVFDESAIKSIVEASPFLPLPEEYKEKSVRIFFEFVCGEK